MKITAKKLTDFDLLRRACEMTTGKSSNVSPTKMYECEHSPIRTQIFWIEMVDIPSFVSTHFVRHHVGVTHFVKSNRDDRGGDSNVDRNTKVNHGMLINAQGLIDMARKRLCKKSHIKTQEVMRNIKMAIVIEDPSLFEFLVPECEYRGGVCHELRPCGRKHKTDL